MCGIYEQEGIEQEDFEAVLTAEMEITQDNIQDWLELGDRDPGFQLLAEEEIATVIFFIYFHPHYQYYYILHLFVFYVFCI
jgi:hypothetical protein